MKPITNMAFYCCGVRMQDALQPQPVCGDIYAQVFMNEYGLDIYDLFKDEANCNASMLVRHRIIDDILRQLLASTSNLAVITIGAGLDSRPYRLTGGKWFELEESAVVAYKNEKLAISNCTNPFQRIAINFFWDNLEERLSLIKHDGPIVIVMEGVFIYLSEDEIRKMLAVFHRLFPAHLLVCDLVNRDMVETYGRTLNEKIEGIGALFKPADYPEKMFTANGYRVKNQISVVERSTDFGINKVPKFLLKCFFSGNVAGNAVYVFEPHESYDDLLI